MTIIANLSYASSSSTQQNMYSYTTDQIGRTIIQGLGTTANIVASTSVVKIGSNVTINSDGSISLVTGRSYVLNVSATSQGIPAGASPSAQWYDVTNATAFGPVFSLDSASPVEYTALTAVKVIPQAISPNNTRWDQPAQLTNIVVTGQEISVG